MLQPKKTKYRKQMKQARHLRGVETRGCKLEFGDFGLRAMESAWITNRQLEAARRAVTRYVKKSGKVWIKVFPDKPISKKPAETRMGSGKGNPEIWAAEVRSGKILYEITGVNKQIALEAFHRAASKLPVRTKLVERKETIL